MHCPTQTSREVTSSSDKEASSDDATHCAQYGVKGGNKQCKQRPLGTTTRTSRDDDRGWEVASKRLVRSPIDPFKRPLEEA
jgi:hypothetical protein